MQVETFECSETAAEPIEASEEAIGLIESLGLTGQKELICKTSGDRDTRCPYREMTAEERFVYGVLCPTKVKLSDYKVAPIPLRVLQIAAHAKSLGLFDELVVWDRESVMVQDPVLVGRKGSEWSSLSQMFILARWGTELESFATLVKRAVAAKKEQLLESVESIRSSIDSEIARVQGLSSADIIKAGPNAHVELQSSFR